MRLLLAALLLSALPAAAQFSQQMLVDDKSASVIELTSVFSFVPPTGYAPMRVKAVNNTTGDLSVSLRTVSEASNSSGGDHQLESSFSLAAPAGKTTEREFLVPLCTQVANSAYSTPDLRIELQAGGRTQTLNFHSGGYANLPFTGFSAALAASSISLINNAAAGSSHSGGYRSGRENFAALCMPAALPSDWRGYSGLDVLAITSDEWSSLQAGQRSAVLQWVKLGGWLSVYAKGDALELMAALNIPTQGEAVEEPASSGVAWHLGNGYVARVSWGGGELPASEANFFSGGKSRSARSAVRRSEYAQSLRESDQSSGKSVHAPLVAALGEKSFAAWQVGIILFIFGIVVGPVNLFYLAGKGRRHRLFFTTPIISLAAAVLLLFVIFFQDGTGGKGHRAALVYLDSAENAAFIHQMQAARTGVLFGGSFDVADNAVVSMAVLPDSRWTRLKGTDADDNRYRYRYTYNRAEPQRYSVQDKAHSGDFFQSRSEQGQIIDAVQPTRGRLELQAGSNPPVITSTISATLDRVCYTDAAGKRWASPGPVTTGAEITLSEVSDENFANWRHEAISMLHSDLRSTVASRSQDAKSFFFASTKDPAAGMVETLDSIEWESSTVFLYGPLK